MDRIAKAAGVSKPTLYSYFQDKEGLFIALVQQLVRANHPIGLRLDHQPDFETPPAVVLRQIAMEVLGNVAKNQPFLTLMRLIIGESEQFPDLSKTFVQEVSQPMLERLAFYFEAHPQLQFPDPIVTARIFSGSIVHYLITQYIMHGAEVMPLESDRMVDGLVNLIIAAGTAKTD